MIQSGQQNRMNALDAKLHQGFDPNAEFKQQGQLLGSVPYQDKEDGHTGVFETLVKTIGNAINNFFSSENAAGDGSDIGVSGSVNGSLMQNTISIENDVSFGFGAAGTLENVSFGAAVNGGLGDGRSATGALADASIGGGISGPAPSSGGGGGGGNPPVPVPGDPDGDLSPPVVTAPDATGQENQATPISIAITVDPNATSNVIVIGNVPLGGVFNQGTNNNDGTWTFTTAQMVGLTFAPPLYASGTYQFTVTVTSSDGTDAVSETVNLQVDISGVATAPLLSSPAVDGNEDSAIALNIDAALVDTDGSESMSIVISGLPVGGVLSQGTDNGDGSWTLTPAQLAGLTFTPPANASGTFNLTVQATTSEDGTTATTTQVLTIDVDGVADVPVVSVQPASGDEDTAIPLTINASLTDTDGSESLSIVISNVPLGSVLSAGQYMGNGAWSLTAADLVGLTMTPPPNFSGNITLQVVAIATEQDGDSIVSAGASLQVTIDPVLDPPIIDVGVSAGLEDQFIVLNLDIEVPDASQLLIVTIGNVPAGAILSAGIDNGNGTWTVTAAQLAGLAIRPPANSDADFNLDLTVFSQEIDGTISVTTDVLTVDVTGVADMPGLIANDVSGLVNTPIALDINGTLSDTDGSESLTFLITGVPDGFALSAGINNGDNSWTLTAADMAIATLVTPYDYQGRLHLNVQALSHEISGDIAVTPPQHFHVDVGNILLGLEIDLALGIGVGVGGVQLGVGVGVGIGLNIGDLGHDHIVLMEDSSLQLSDAPGLLGQLAAPLLGLLTSIKVSGLAPGVTLSNGVDLGNGEWRLTPAELGNLWLTSAPNADQDFTIIFEAELIGLLPVLLDTTEVHVVGIADVPTLNVAIANGVEDGGGIPLTINVALGVDLDGSENLSIVVRDLPTGFMLNHGIYNSNGTWSLTVADLVGLEVTPPAHFSGDVTYTVDAITTERDGDASVVSVSGQLHVDAAVDAPVVAVNTLEGVEGQPIALALGVSLLDQDGSESIVSITVSGLPGGFSLTYATDNGDGTWSIDFADLAQVQLLSPPDWHGDASFSVAVSAQESVGGPLATTNATILLSVDARADTPLAFANDVYGDVDQAIVLDLSAMLTDTDGSEQLSVVIGGMQDGYTLSVGQNNGDGTWTLSEAQLANVSLLLADDVQSGQDIQLTVTAHAIETSNGDHAYSTTQDFTVHV